MCSCASLPTRGTSGLNLVDMELTIENAQTVFALPVSLLGPYLPRVFERFRNSETDGHWVDAYLVSQASEK